MAAYANAKRMKNAGGMPMDPMATGQEFGQDDILAMAQARLQQNLPASIGLSKGDSVTTSEAGPASTADIMRLLDIAGIKNDGSKIDLKPYMSKREPDLAALKEFATNRPTEVSLRGLDQIANALSSTDRKVKFEGPGHTADKSLNDWTALGEAIQGERDNDFKKQQDMFKAISGITSQRGSSSSRTSDSVNFSIPQAPRGAGAPKMKELTPAQLKEIQMADDAVRKTESVLSKLGNNGGWVGPVDRFVPDLFSSREKNEFRADLGRLHDTYRSLTTGAAAPFAELEMILNHLPTDKDQLPAFKQKAASLIQEIKNARDSRVQMYQGLGRNLGQIPLSTGGNTTQTKEAPKTDKMPQRVMSYDAWVKAGKPKP